MRALVTAAMLGTSLLAVGLVAALAQGRDEAPAAALPEVRRVVALGEVLPQSDVILLSGPTGQDPGVVERVAVVEGQWVAAGEVLAVLDTHVKLGAALRQAEASVLQKRAELSQLEADLAADEAQLLADLQALEAERDRADWDHDRSRTLTASGVYTAAHQIDKRLALEGWNRQVDSASIALQRVRARDATGLSVDAAVARADLQAAEAAAEEARANHDRAYIRAPLDARVLHLIARQGEEIGAEGFAELGDTASMLVRAEVFEADLRYLALGQPAEVTARALDGRLSGTLERVGLMVKTQDILSGDPAASVDARVVEAWIRLDAESSQRVRDMTGLQVRVFLTRRTPDGA
ncbi:MAG: ABC exporter membrane fusion protein [Rhodospirillales bacterium]